MDNSQKTVVPAQTQNNAQKTVVPPQTHIISVQGVHEMEDQFVPWQGVRKMLTLAEYSDITLLIGYEKRPYRCHKYILVDKCPYLKSLITANTKILDLPHFDPSSFFCSLEHIYSGSGFGIQRGLVETARCVDIADKLQLPTMKADAMNTIVKAITVRPTRWWKVYGNNVGTVMIEVLTILLSVYEDKFEDGILEIVREIRKRGYNKEVMGSDIMKDLLKRRENLDAAAVILRMYVEEDLNIF